MPKNTQSLWKYEEQQQMDTLKLNVLSSLFTIPLAQFINLYEIEKKKLELLD
jgi:hypothetical protein